MIIEKSLERLGLVVPDLEQFYRTNPSGAKFVSHVAVQNVLYLSGTVPLKDGKPFLRGYLGKDLTLAEGYEAARYAALVSLGAMKYALGDLDRVERIIQLLGFVNSDPGSIKPVDGKFWASEAETKRRGRLPAYKCEASDFSDEAKALHESVQIDLPHRFDLLAEALIPHRDLFNQHRIVDLRYKLHDSICSAK